MKRSVKKWPYSLCLLSPIFFFQVALAEPGLSLSIKVIGAKPNRGQLILSLFSSPENYLNTPVNKKTRPSDNEGQALFQFPNLRPGTYAISIVYDEDGNGKLNTGFLGIPTELVGFSNNAKGRFGPPSFERTSFKVNKNSTVIIYLGKAKN